MAGRHAARQVTRRQAEERHQLRIPVARVQVPELRAGRALRVREHRLLAGEPVDEKTGLRPPAERACRHGLAHGRQVVQRPAQLAGAVVRRQEEPRLAVHLLGLRLELPQPRVRAAILPAENRRKRPAAAASQQTQLARWLASPAATTSPRRSRRGSRACATAA